MCVDIARSVVETNKVQYAWKAICRSSTPTVWRPISQGGVFKRGKWQTALNSQYGFNCYGSRRAAHTWHEQTVRVRVRRVHGFGYDNKGYRVIFAREIFVPHPTRTRSK